MIQNEIILRKRYRQRNTKVYSVILLTVASILLLGGKTNKYGIKWMVRTKRYVKGKNQALIVLFLFELYFGVTKYS